MSKEITPNKMSPQNPEQPHRVFALLIGIDHYDYYRESKGDIDLSGCVSDSLEVERFLRNSISLAQECLFIRKLHSPLPGLPLTQPIDLPVALEESFPATRDHIIDGFLSFLTQAGPEDIALIHYSGHGSFEYRPEQLQHIDVNEREQGETILCQDSYTEREGEIVPPLRDLEIRWLMAQVAQKEPPIVALMDCCNASGNTRYMKKKSVKVRFTTPPDPKKADIKSFVFYQKDPEAKQLLDHRPTDFQLPLGRHVALYACLSHELAKEYGFPEGSFGVFTYYLLQTLRATKGNISYRDLIKLVRVKTTGKVSYQSPQSFALQPKDMDLFFLNQRTAQNQRFYTVRPGETARQGIMDAGSLHGLSNEQEGITQLTLYSNSQDIQTASPEMAIKGFIKKVAPHESIIELEKGHTFPAGEAFLKAIITASPLEKLKVCLSAEVEEEEIDLPEKLETPQQKRLAEGFSLIQASLQKDALLKLVPVTQDWDYRIYAYYYQGQEKYRISHKDDVRALLDPHLGFTENSAEKIAQEIAHIARWEKTKNLVNAHNSILKPGDFELIATDANDNIVKADHGEIILEQKLINGAWTSPPLKFKVVLHNHDCPPLFCALLHLSQNYEIRTNYLPDDAFLGAQSFVDSGQRLEWEKWEIYMASHLIGPSGKPDKKGLPLNFEVPQDQYELGITEVEDHFKLIVSTEQFDPLHLHQGPLREAKTFRSSPDKPARSQLEALMSAIQDRPGRPYRGKIVLPEMPKISDWQTSLLTVKTRRAQHTSG